MIDRVWWDPELGRIVGDMGFTFCDRDETRTEDVEALRRDLREWREVDVFDDDIAVYLLCEVDALLEDDDDDLVCASLDWDTYKEIEAYVCATREQAKDADLTRYPKVFYYD